MADHPVTRTPLHLIAVACHRCGDVNNLLDVNLRHQDLYNETGKACVFPKDGLTDEQWAKVKAIRWTCEECHDDEQD